MNIQRKLALIVIASILLSAIPISIVGYYYTKEKILDKEIIQLTQTSQILSERAIQRFKTSQPKLEHFAALLETELAKPITKKDLEEFHQKIELNRDGVWRNRKTQFDGQKESGIFLPPNSLESDTQKILHLRIKRVMDIYGAAASRPLEDIWYLSPYRSMVVFDSSLPDFAFDMAADIDYTQAPWLTYSSPSLNPMRKLRFTPPLYDPVPKSWMVSAIYPLYMNNQWLGSIGEDIKLTNVLANIFTINQLYKGTQNFLLDAQNNYILAGDWQEELESTKVSSKFSIKNERDLVTLLKTPVQSRYKLITKNLSINGKKYIAIGSKFDMPGWRHYKLVPIEAIMQPAKQLFNAIFFMIFLVALMGGALINFAVNQTVVKRIRRLAEAMNFYELGGKSYVAPSLPGSDDISLAAQEFDLMQDRIDQYLTEANTANNALQASERELRQSEQQFRMLVANVPGAAYQCELDTDWTMRYVGDAIQEITGYPSSDFIGNAVRSYASLILMEPSMQDERVIAAIKAGKSWEEEYQIRCADGKIRWVYDKGQAHIDEYGNIDSVAGFIYDITETKEHQKQLEQIAHYDMLTNLPNRALLADRLEQAILRSQRSNQSIAVAYMDLDGFKYINDQYGHSIGDDLLIGLGQRMNECLREGDTFSRIGGDEFVALMVDLDLTTDCEPLLQRLLEAAAKPILIGSLELKVSASIGVTRYPQDGSDADQLMRQADQAMYLAKQAGKNGYHLFDVAQDIAVKTQRESLQRISTAIEQAEFVLYYQPKVNMRTGVVIGAEALIRWQHPEHGLLPPSMFLPVTENHPLSLTIGDWVIDTALAQISEWQAIGLNLPVSVNVSALQLQQENFTTRLSELLRKHSDVNPEDLELEIVETSAIKDIGQISELMQACRLLGVHFSLDDFGTGYSSLTYLKRLPASMLKIDQSFVRDMIDDADDLAIVEGVVGLAKAFHREVIAEGVETIAHGKLLLKLGCELAQGYGIARPMAASEMQNWVKTWRPDVAWTSKLQLINS